MANVKKTHLLLRRCGLYNLLISVLILPLPYVLLHSFTCSFVLLVFCVTLSTLNILIAQGKSFKTTFLSKSSREEPKTSVESFAVIRRAGKFIIVLIFGVCLYHFTAIVFGAPFLESFHATLYFSCFMAVSTLLPACSYAFINGNGIVEMFLVLLEKKHYNAIENYLHTMAVWTVVGAWFGAFPIPLDWDRPWQEWPITCCIGASIGYAGAHIFLGAESLWKLSKDRKKLPWNIFV